MSSGNLSSRSNLSTAAGTIKSYHTPRGNEELNQTSQNQDYNVPQDSYRSTMSTARVYTALAALTAEREALKAKLSLIDSQLESSKKKKALSYEKK